MFTKLNYRRTKKNGPITRVEIRCNSTCGEAAGKYITSVSLSELFKIRPHLEKTAKALATAKKGAN